MSVTINVLFFAKAREIVGKKQTKFVVNSTINYRNLFDLIVKEFNLLLIRDTLILAVNEEYCNEDSELTLKEDDVVALIPPISGEKLSLDAINDLVVSPKCGAISFFVGTTRDNFEHKKVLKLQYEAYESMALKSMKTLCNDTRNKYPTVENIAIYHRLGEVPVKEASVIIATSAIHRKEAIEATETLINEFKRVVPIWKKEIYEGVESNWKENGESSYPSKRKLFHLTRRQSVTVPNVPQHLIQIKADNAEIERRISRFIECKRKEIDAVNVREFCRRDADEYSCARIDSVLMKRKDSKSHLQVNRVLNNYNRDVEDGNVDHLLKYLPKNGIDERLLNLEVQLSMNEATPKNVYVRLKLLEDRLLYLESLSPEYTYILQRKVNPIQTKRKKSFTVEDIDRLINELKKERK